MSTNDLLSALQNASRRALFTQRQRGFLGKVTGVSTASNFDVADRPHYTYVRLQRGSDETVVECFNIIVGNIPDLPVWVGRDVNNNLAILELDQATAALQYPDSSVPNTTPHGGTHWVAGTDPVLISPLQVQNFRTYPTSPASLSVGVSSYLYYYNGAWCAYAGGTIDLTAKVPTGTVTTQRIIIVGIDKATNTLTTVDGANKYITATHWYSIQFDIDDIRDLLETSALPNFEPSAAVRLYGGQTAIKQLDIWRDAKITTGGQGAASGTGSWDVDLPPSVPGSIDDEFEDGTIPGAWEYINSTAWTESTGSARRTETSQVDYEVRGIAQALPAGDFTIVTKMSVSFTPNTGDYGIGLALFESDEDHNVTICGFYTIYDDAPVIGYMKHADGARSYWTSAAGRYTDYISGEWLYLRLRRSSTTYYLDWSADGSNWLGNDTIPVAFTPTKVGVALVNYAAGTSLMAAFEFFRYRNQFDTAADPTYGNFDNFIDEKVKVSANDTVAGRLSDKLVEGNYITLTVLNDGANETLEASADGLLSLTGGELTGELTITVPAGDSALTTPGVAELGGGLIVNVTSINNASSPYDVLLSDHVILGDTTLGAITVNLPAMGSIQPGRLYDIKNTGTGSVTIDGYNSELIDNNLTHILTSYQRAQIVGDGAAWWII
jgi:hypothetical protein